jgi:Fe-S cluster assembly protein SufD
MHDTWQIDQLLALQKDVMVPLAHWQEKQLHHFAMTGFPHHKMENWKYTSVSDIAKQAFTMAAPATVSMAAIAPFMIVDAYVIVFVNGHFAPALSRIQDLPAGVILTQLKSVIKQTAWQKKLSIPDNYQTPFSLLNDGLFDNGLFLQLAPNVRVDRPIQLIYWMDASAQGQMSHPRHVIMAAENSQATIIEEYIGAEATPYFNNVVNQVFISANANLQWYKLQNEGNQAFHVANTIVQQQQGSAMASYHFTAGAQLARDDLNVVLQQTQAQCQLWGFYQLKNTQHADHHTRIDHHVPHCHSQQNYKGIMDDRSHAVFNGKVIVHANAIKTQATQSNKNLLLSRTANVDTKPELEIYADDVRCTHGATVGQLDQQALFYLRSRGIAQPFAEKILMSAFAHEIIDAIPHDFMIEKIKQTVAGDLLCV